MDWTKCAYEHGCVQRAHCANIGKCCAAKVVDCVFQSGCNNTEMCAQHRGCLAFTHSDVMREIQAEKGREVPRTTPLFPLAVSTSIVEPASSVANQDHVAATLAARGHRYGDFTDNASVSQDLKGWLCQQNGWHFLDPIKREALEMIAQKIARILNGDSNYKDNWHDIAGYARLAEERCEERGEASSATPATLQKP